MGTTTSKMTPITMAAMMPLEIAATTLAALPLQSDAKFEVYHPDDGAVTSP